MSLAATVSTGVGPAWPYIVGGVAAIITSLIGGWRLYVGWRAGVEEEAEKKALNTRALTDNTRAAERNSQTIAGLSQRLDRWELRWERFAEKTETRLSALEDRPPPSRRRPPAQGGT